MKRNFKKGKGIFGLFFIAIIFVLSGAVMLLWNAVLPDLLNVNPISYWQAMGLLVLSRILFGRFGKPNNSRFSNNKFKERFDNMTPEEKEQLKEKWKNRCK